MPTRAAPLALVLLLVGCGGVPMACTDIGSVAGIAVTVDPSIAAYVTRVSLRVCWAGTCRVKVVQLSPGSDTVDQGCDGTDPDSACSASAVPNGTKVGFAELTGLPEGKISVAATTTQSGKPRSYGSVDLVPKATFPNGPLCGAGGNQAQVTIGPRGLK